MIQFPRVLNVIKGFLRTEAFQRKRLWQGLLIAVVGLAPYIIFVFPNCLVVGSGDYPYFQLPIRVAAREEILNGRLPLWSPHLTCGAPVHAAQQAGFAHLFATLPVLALGANAGLKISIFVHVTWGYLGQFVLCRFYNISSFGSNLAALAFIQGGFLVFHLLEGHVNLVFGYAFIPWFLWGVATVLKTPNCITLIRLAAIAACLLLVGQPQLAYYCALLCGPLVVGSVAFGVASRHRIRCVAHLVGAGVLTLCLSAVQLLPAMELAWNGYEHSERGTFLYAIDHSAHPLDALTFVWPSYMGLRLAGQEEFAFPHGFSHERTGYMGIMTLLLAASAFFRTTERWQWAYIGLVIGCIIIALGPHTPLFYATGSHIPGLFSFRCPARTLAIINVLVPLLAGRGFDAITQSYKLKAGFQLFLPIAFVWIAINLLYMAVEELCSVHEYWLFVRDTLFLEFVFALAMAVVSVLVFLALPVITRWGTSTAFLSVGLVLALDLWGTNARHIHLDPPSPLPTLPPVSDASRAVRIVDAPHYPVVTEIDLSYSAYVPAVIANKWTSVITDEGGVKPVSVMRVWDALINNTGPALSAAGVSVIGTRSELKHFENACPRAYFVQRDCLVIIRKPISDLTLQDVRTLQSRLTLCPDIVDQSTTMSVKVNADEDGVFVLLDTDYPGWICREGDKVHPIIPVFSVFRGISLTAGQHSLEFSYEPKSVHYGCAITALGLTSVVGVLCLDLLSKRGGARDKTR